MTWVNGALAVVCLALAPLHVLRVALLRRDVAVEVSSAVMALGMAAMFSPLDDPLPQPVWTGAFVLSAAWFGALVVRGGGLHGEAGHHVIGSAAMLFMLAAGHTHAATGIASVVAIALTGYFAWHALRCADRCRSLPAAPDGAGAPAVGLRTSVLALRAPQAAAAAHLVMAVAMAVMLLGMV
ncbi:DUF5134 domain-containing protein [Pseudonocardia nigra]|uniref:DUF5134 domain-containing protein n=1 Tax=Pseudonocardia nigra TaxID=1921578 RepID=UPI001C5DEB8A|nr:DUF5134 domain-containing protein [Pseudonocardia nigra]